MGAQAKGVHNSVVCLFPVPMVPCSKHAGRLGPFRRACIPLSSCNCGVSVSEARFEDAYACSLSWFVLCKNVSVEEPVEKVFAGRVG